jgi:hypothetical protein
MGALSKSKFKQGLECPNKLYFTNNKTDYNNLKEEDTFLQALASGGFQIGEYACLHYPEGILVDGSGDVHDYQKLANQTSALLEQENVVLFEAAFYINNLFIRTDILVKEGDNIKLIEVKAKSINPHEKHIFVGPKGGLSSSWKPYLFDLAFQTHVAKLCLPNFKITSYLCLVDKTKTATVDGLNQLFRIKQGVNKKTEVTVLDKNISRLGNSLLTEMDLSEVVKSIHNDTFKYYENLNFLESISLLSDIQINNYYPNWPTQFSACKKCEFKNDAKSQENQKKSGFEHCFKTQFNWSEIDFNRPNIFNVWNLKNPKLMEQGILFKDQLTREDIKYKEKSDHLDPTQRQWLQIEKERNKDLSEFVYTEALKLAIDSWQFPLHFIDFETSTVPLPFHIGRSPYEQIAFQFSHHIFYEDGRVEHANQYINTKPGEFPNFKFIEQLQKALSKDEGTIFRYATHENTILNAIRDQLKGSNYSDKESLVSFIEAISHPKDKHPDSWIVPLRKSGSGTRNMVDLCDIVKKYYYNPHTYGSNSIKKVLPAVLKSSKFIQEKYSKPISDIGVGSLNFPLDHIWLKESNGEIVSPYKTLPPVYENLSHDEIEEKLSDIENIDDGGAALTAYGKIQYMDMSEEERVTIADALKRYCELDTLAMVMIFEHLKSLTT